MDVLLQKLQSEYMKNKNPKTEGKLQEAKRTSGAIRKQLDALGGGPSAADVSVLYSEFLYFPRSVSNIAPWRSQGPTFSHFTPVLSLSIT